MVSIVPGTSLEAPLSRLDWLSRLPDGPAGVPCGSRPHRPGVASPSRPTRQDGRGNACCSGFDALVQHAPGQSERTSEDETRSVGRSEGNSRGGRGEGGEEKGSPGEGASGEQTGRRPGWSRRLL